MHKLSLTVAEACALSGLSRSTMYRLFAEGALVPRKVGRRTLVIFAELENCLRSLPKAPKLAGRDGRNGARLSLGSQDSNPLEVPPHQKSG